LLSVKILCCKHQAGFDDGAEQNVCSANNQYSSTRFGIRGKAKIGGDWSLNRSFLLRPKGFNNAEGLSTIRWSDIARCYSNTDAFDCSTRRNGATYLSPEWSGFSFGWGYYKDDIWSASVRYKSPKEWKNWKVGGGFAYEDFRDERIQMAAAASQTGPSPWGSGGPAGETTLLGNFFLAAFSKIFLVKT
jgi:hypothetical protein